MKILSTRAHGYLDLALTGAMVALPRMFGSSAAATTMLTATGVGILGLGLVTRHELGAVKLIPMNWHLKLDTLSGALNVGAALLMPDEASRARTAMLGLGLVQVVAGLSTRAERSRMEQLGRAVGSWSGVVRDAAGSARTAVGSAADGARTAIGVS